MQLLVFILFLVGFFILMKIVANNQQNIIYQREHEEELSKIRQTQLRELKQRNDEEQRLQEHSKQVKETSRDLISFPEDVDPLLPEAVDFVIEAEKASVSMLRREFKIGYNRARGLINQLESIGIIGSEDGSKPRKVLLTYEQLKTISPKFDEAYYKKLLYAEERRWQKIQQQQEDRSKMIEIKPEIDMDLIGIRATQRKLLLEKQPTVLMPEYNSSTVYKEPEKNLKNHNFIVIDVETTGLDQEKHEIIEIAAVRFVDFKPIEYMATLIKPSRNIPKKITEINGIYDDMVMTAPQLYLVAKSFLDFLSKEKTIVAHNLPFDLRFLFANKINLFEYKPKRKFFDTLIIARNRLKGQVSNNKLDTLLVHFDIYRPVAHRALDDCIATGMLFKELMGFESLEKDSGIILSDSPTKVEGKMEKSEAQESKSLYPDYPYEIDPVVLKKIKEDENAKFYAENPTEVLKMDFMLRIQEIGEVSVSEVQKIFSYTLKEAEKYLDEVDENTRFANEFLDINEKPLKRIYESKPIQGAKMKNNLRNGKGESKLELLDSYIVIDIETTGFSPRYDDIIELGALKVSNGDIIEAFSTLVKPSRKISGFITSLTGITAEMTSDMPCIKTALPDFLNFIGDSILLGHNVSFDINFIYDNCIACGLPIISNDFIDTLRISRRVFSNLESYSLMGLVSEFKFNALVEHRATADCTLINELYKYIKSYITENKLDTASLFNLRNKNSFKAIDITTEKTDFDKSHLLYNKVCVFTGKLDKMPRKEAMQIVVDYGGICGDGVTKKTNYLILGNNDYCSAIKDGKSAKHKKAEQYILEGYDLAVIPEDVFYDLLEDKSA